MVVFGDTVVIAHREYSGKYPENTLEAFDNAKYYAENEALFHSPHHASLQFY